MNTITKTPEQIEFREIFDRIEKEFKYSRADVSRALHVSRSYITMLLDGKRTPEYRTLQDMRDLEARLKAGREQAKKAETGTDLHDLLNRLTLMEKHDKAGFEKAKRVLDVLLPEPSSGVAQKASKLLKKASASQHKEGADPSP